MDQRTFGVHRPITIEARLYLDSEYQTLVEKQAIIQGGPDDPDLAQAVASLTQNLLGPSGAYRAVATGQRTAYATITPTKWETEIQPHGVADDLRWGPIAGVAGASRSRHLIISPDTHPGSPAQAGGRANFDGALRTGFGLAVAGRGSWRGPAVPRTRLLAGVPAT